MRTYTDPLALTTTAPRVMEFVVADLAEAARFWNPLMGFLGWTRTDDGIGALVYEGGNTAVVFVTGDAWDQAVNERRRVNPFAHLAFDLHSHEELASLRASLARRADTEVGTLRRVLDGERWVWTLDVRDPSGLDVEVRCPAC